LGIGTVTDDSFQEAQAFFNAGNYRRCHELAVEGLAKNPNDVTLLRFAGKCSLELDLGDASGYLQKAVNLRPDDVDAWRDLGDALVEEGNLPEAATALREAVRLRPYDAAALVDLGHISFVMGDTEAAIENLSRAAQVAPGNLAALRSLVEMYRRANRLQDALDTATRIVELKPDDVLATMDVGDLNQALGNFDAAVAAYSRLRTIDTDPEHEVYAYHGMIQAEMLRDRWRRVLDLSIDATRVDRFGLTTDLLAFAVSQVFGASDRPAPSRAEIDASLAAELAEHRRLHTEELAL
jgi:tetratricopeptide (TPR) repeat protein